MPQNSFRLYQNADGPVLGTVSAPILEQDGLFFKDLARTGQLLPYEDWRLPAQIRAEDLAARLSIEEIAGLMMYSPHQMIPTLPGDPFQGSYNGKPFPGEMGAHRSAEGFPGTGSHPPCTGDEAGERRHCRPVEQCHPAGSGGTALGHSGECVQ